MVVAAGDDISGGVVKDCGKDREMMAYESFDTTEGRWEKRMREAMDRKSYVRRSVLLQNSHNVSGMRGEAP